MYDLRFTTNEVVAIVVALAHYKRLNGNTEEIVVIEEKIKKAGRARPRIGTIADLRE